MKFKTIASSLCKRGANKERGLSLAEAGLVLALGMIAAVLAFAAYSTGNKNITTTSQVNAAIELQNSITRAYSSANSYADLDNTVVASGGLLPKAFRATGEVTSTKGLTTAWGGGFMVRHSDDDAAFFIAFDGVPQNACIDFVSGIASTESVIYLDDAILKTPSSPLDVNALASACGELESNGTTIYMGSPSYVRDTGV